ncbi:MAG: hypothetical protein IKB16_15815 [Lentisphaeria bacterium]|nr:hypothetical protein [Lentisphaeria bacterium]
MNAVKNGDTVLLAFCRKQALLVSAFFVCVVILLTGCDQAPLPPDIRFAENYLREQTYNHCKRYARMYPVYSTGESDRYVFFSAPENINHEGWKIRNSEDDTEFSCMFRRYDMVGQVYHEMISHEFSPLVKTNTEKYPYTTKLKIEFICMDKLYHDNLEYNAGIIWIFEKEKYADFSKMDLQNQFTSLWKITSDLQLLTWRMKKDTASGKKMVREVPMRYDAENTTWQWQNIKGKWCTGFESETKLDSYETLKGADTPVDNLQQMLSGAAAENNSVLSMDYVTYLCANTNKDLLTRHLQNEFLFFCPGKKEPLWLEKDQFKASKQLVDIYNRITVEHKKVTVWQGLQSLNQNYKALQTVQDLIWNHVDKELEKTLAMICNTDFIETDKKKMYLNKFLKRLDECSNLQEHTRFLHVKELCDSKLAKIKQEEEEE